MKLLPVLVSLLLLIQPVQSAFADSLDDLEALGSGNIASESNGGDDLSSLSDSGDSLDSMGDSSDLSAAADPVEEAPASEPSIQFGGYIKPLVYWSSTEFTDDMYGWMQTLGTAPEKQKEEKFTDAGSRIQLKMEGYLGDSARLFTAVNIDYNEVRDAEESATDTRVIESYIELFEGSRTWKIGNQLITWGFMEGIEVPTDRINARDSQYNSTEYEDGKLASTGIYLKQSIGGFSSFDLFYAPTSSRNVDPEYLSYFVNDARSTSDYEVDESTTAARLFISSGNLDFAISYVHGMDNAFDLEEDASGNSYKTYNKVDSSGLDLQYNFGSFLAKLAYVQYVTEDKDGDDPLVKNNWNKYIAGVEFIASGLTFNVYAGQEKIADFDKLVASGQIDAGSTSLFLGQTTETMDFVSGHINGSFLTGDALGMTVLFASYWEEDGETVRQILMPSFTYKVANGLEVGLGGGYVNYADNIFQSVKTEVKYSF